MGFKKGNIPHNRGKKGIFHHTEEHKQKMREIGKKRDLTLLHNTPYTSWNKGKTGVYSQEVIKQKREQMKGNTRWLGRKHSEETKEKMREIGKKRDVSFLLGIPHKTWNKGRTGVYTKETLQKMSVASLGHKRLLGKKLSEETKQRIGKSNKGKHPMTEERKQKLRERCGDKAPWHGKTHTPETKEKMRLARLKAPPLPFKDTTIEKTLQEGLTEYGIAYQKHLPICNICRPDMVFPELKIAVFADGDYWHSQKIKDGKVWERDRNQEKVLTNNGWKVLRFWEHEIRSNPRGCIVKMIETIYDRRKN
jgi:DNA mismatch endonuclease (patch repair protein)